MDGSFVAISAYFNPRRYRTKRANFECFRTALERQGVPLIVVECAFDDRPFELPRADWTVQVRSRSIVWQKERLLNLAVAVLPPTCTKVAWLDADILFEDDSWAERASAALEDTALAQLFETVVRLPRGARLDTGEGRRWPSFAAVHNNSPNTVRVGWFSDHGHTGFAWAAQRHVLDRFGLYDAALSGCGDHLMAHAFVRDLESRCVRRALGHNEVHRRHLREWSDSVAPRVDGRIGLVEGRIFHLWHGDHADRRYDQRSQELGAFAFDPALHIQAGGTGCWEWANASPELEDWARDYFAQRREDGHL